MYKFEILCVTMNQSDFSKINEMNIHSNVVFANQCDHTAYEKIEFDGHIARMISTQTRGVGINRNIALMYADSDICLFADDDIVYRDDMESLVVSEFDAHPDADVIIFHFESDDEQRPQKKYSQTKKCGRFARMPWGGVRIAVRLSALRKSNVFFSTLFGGGCIFPSGEDSMFVTELRRAGLTFYVSKETIGRVSFESSTWFTGYDQKYYYGKGVFYQAARPKFKYIWMLYFVIRTHKYKNMKVSDKLRWMYYGFKGYKEMISYNDFIDRVLTDKK